MWTKKQHFTLIELLIYMGALIVIGTLVLGLFYTGLQNAKSIRQSASDINRVSVFGDKWRKDIRNADEVEIVDGKLILSKDGESKIYYEFDQGTVWKRKEGDKFWKAVLLDVKSCCFSYRHDGDLEALNLENYQVLEGGDNPYVWQLEIELKSRNKKSKIKPRFYFIAVTAGKK